MYTGVCPWCRLACVLDVDWPLLQCWFFFAEVLTQFSLFWCKRLLKKDIRSTKTTWQLISVTHNCVFQWRNCDYRGSGHSSQQNMHIISQMVRKFLNKCSVPIKSYTQSDWNHLSKNGVFPCEWHNNYNSCCIHDIFQVAYETKNIPSNYTLRFPHVYIYLHIMLLVYINVQHCNTSQSIIIEMRIQCFAFSLSAFYIFVSFYLFVSGNKHEEACKTALQKYTHT
jgi:hypothetical protein